jgi:UDP-N-acetylglucosamine:LPS N-acetylglucosamine transferase
VIDLGAGSQHILAISSGGGHWVQLLRLRPAFEGHRVTYVTVSRAYAADVPGCRFRAIPDATRWSKLRLLHLAFRVAWVVLTERPAVVVSTGAAPGYFAVRLGKWLGARTIWIDSIANVERLSLSGQRIGPHADLWLTQWPHLVRPEGPHFLGGVL